MPIDHLLFEALVPARTKAEDKRHGGHTSTDIKPQAGETVLLFRLDETKTRDHLGLADKKCCDYLYFVKKDARCYLIFVELKSSNLGEAVEQITNAFLAIDGRCKLVREPYMRRLGVIVHTSGSPGDVKSELKQASRKGIDIHPESTRKDRAFDLRKYII